MPRCARKHGDVIFWYPHGGQRFLERRVVEKIERDVGLVINAVPSANNECVLSAVNPRRCLFDLGRHDNGYEGGRRLGRAAQCGYRSEDDGASFVFARRGARHLKRAGDECEGLLFGVGGHYIRPRRRLLQPDFETALVGFDRAVEKVFVKLGVGHLGPAGPALF